MTMVLVLLPLSLLLAGGAIAAFRWAARDGQFDDLTRGAFNPLVDDTNPAPAAPRASAPEPRRQDRPA